MPSWSSSSVTDRGVVSEDYTGNSLWTTLGFYYLRMISRRCCKSTLSMTQALVNTFYPWITVAGCIKGSQRSSEVSYEEMNKFDLKAKAPVKAYVIDYVTFSINGVKIKGL
ncbi:hypothetical protein NPIL_376811 [Nephila pilipes]|uniref:Uncharacterized protein n=1 Tax=Nephila pilipes TaxID=299642 RepID=A0A8X6U307_NEPPI|nr:hypothetical protein NPIL_376811 [Nephila pilipes]